MKINGYEIKAGADLIGADLIGADLSDADLRRANLRRADLRRADLSYADLRRANLSYADLSDADLSDADLRRADLSDADLRGADLSDADLRGADLSDANLSYADLRGADLSDADLRGADLPGTVKIDNLFTRIQKSINDGGKLKMGAWHECKTTHCIAGWVTTLAGETGRVMEELIGTPWAATLIIMESCPYLNGIVPNFYGTNEEGMAFINECAERELELGE